MEEVDSKGRTLRRRKGTQAEVASPPTTNRPALTPRPRSSPKKSGRKQIVGRIRGKVTQEQTELTGSSDDNTVTRMMAEQITTDGETIRIGQVSGKGPSAIVNAIAYKAEIAKDKTRQGIVHNYLTETSGKAGTTIDDTEVQKDVKETPMNQDVEQMLQAKKTARKSIDDTTVVSKKSKGPPSPSKDD